MTTPDTTQTASPIQLWYTRCGAATASALAIRQGWLQAEFTQGGTVLHSLRDSDDQELRNAHFHHRQTGLFREGGNIPPIWARAGGQETAVIGITWIDEYQGILVRDDGPIRELADLAGKRLGIPLHAGSLIDFQRGAAQHGFASAFRLAGASGVDATLVDIEAPAGSVGSRNGTPTATSPVLDALQRGDVDAIFLRFAGGVRAARQPGVRELINLGAHADPLVRVNNGTPRPVTVDRAFLRRHPDIVARYLAVLLRTGAWAAGHPDEVPPLLAADTSSQSVEDVIASHGARVHQAFTPALSDQYIAGLTEQKNFLRDWGYLQADFDVADWIDPAPLAQARRLVEQRPELLDPATPLAA